MDKLTMAHDYLRDIIKASGGNIDVVEMPEAAWKYADAMQAEAEERVNKDRPGVLCEVDWSQAPSDAIGWVMMQNYSYWHGEEGYLIEEAPSFGFTGSHIMERPHGF